MKEASKTQKGSSVEYKFFSWCLEQGLNVSQPICPDCSYDCILETRTGQLLKLQIKRGYAASNTQNSFCFKCRSSYSRNKNSKQHIYSQNEIDGFVVWYEKIPSNFLFIPIKKATKSDMVICYQELKNKNQNWYKDFLITDDTFN